jgi:hypothetical protein
MKHLRKFNESDNTMLDSNNIGDILLDIIDIGYRCHVTTNWWDDGDNNIVVVIYGIEEFDKRFDCNVDYIYIDQVIETIDRLFDYLKSEGYEPEISSIKKVEVIKQDPETFGIKDRNKESGEIKKKIGQCDQVVFRYDNEKKKWKISGSIGLGFSKKH